MTAHTPTAPGTEMSSVPGAAPLTGSDNARAVAALQFFNALTALSQGSSAAPTVKHTDDALDVDTAPAASVAEDQPPSPPPRAGFQTRGPWIAGNLYIVVPTSHLLPIAKDPVAEGEDSPLWYAITKGRYIGVTLSNPLALASVVGASGSHMRAYKTQSQALDVFNESLDYRMLAVISA
ncbi:hypothetical protein DFH07DRAFT_765293 [Mycena maculata]|uniref:Uncharacterized protein n=1 Tax=Mycena maculata TaxID=230809 RepID=A0AAD7NYP5_9AGAR|nr:hypothetical protein DFH07DRAFT_765293 [Mycena maculata]